MKFLNKLACLAMLLILYVFLLSGSTVSGEVPINENRVRVAFITDIHFGETSDNVPMLAKNALDSIHPDFIFDMGDMTYDSRDREFEAYNQWKNDQCAPIYAVMGNHDRERSSGPYGTGFFSICGYTSATRTLKMGNLVFILISEDRLGKGYTPDPEFLESSVSDQKIAWIKSQLEKYSNNNIFILEHCPLNGTTAWSDYWSQTGTPPWKRISDKMKELLYKYENHVVAHISGHVHTYYAWVDTPDDFLMYKYGDYNSGTEYVGLFVNGAEINRENREYPPYHLPEVYFLNIQALHYTHGPLVNRENATATIYYADLVNGENKFTIVIRDIRTNKDVDNYTVYMKFPIDIGVHRLQVDTGISQDDLGFPIDIGDHRPRFMESDLEIISKDTSSRIAEDNWFQVNSGQESTVIFQKRWAENVRVKGIKVYAAYGSYGDIEYKGSSDTGATWSDWFPEPPECVDVLQVRIRFSADQGRKMEVYDVEVEVWVEDSTPPSPFDLISPEDGAVIHDNTPTLGWEASSDSESGLDHYEVWLDNSNVDNVPAGITMYEASELSEGSHEWYVVAVDGVSNKRKSDVWVFKVVKLVDVEVTNLSISPMEVEPGELVTISVDVRNLGGAGVTEDVELSVNGEVVDSKSVTLGPGENQVVSFTLHEDEAGVYEVEVDGLTGSFEVVEPGVPILPIIVGVIITIALIGMLVYKKSGKMNKKT